MAPPPSAGFFASTSRVFYAGGFTLSTVMAFFELGLLFQQLQGAASEAGNYQGREYKQSLGIMLFSILATLVVSFTHYLNGMKLTAAALSVLAFTWAAGAELVSHTSPFRGSSCKLDTSILFARPFPSECGRIVGIEAFARAESGLMVLILMLMASDAVSFKLSSDCFYSKSPAEIEALEKARLRGV